MILYSMPLYAIRHLSTGMYSVLDEDRDCLRCRRSPGDADLFSDRQEAEYRLKEVGEDGILVRFLLTESPE